jgi:hypothetical protein
VHGVEPFDVPAHWTKFRSMDWGSSRPFSVGWWCVSDGTELADGRVYPRGAVIRYREWYGWTGVPNVGARMEVREVARGVVSRSLGERYAYSVADPSMWKVDGGESHAETFAKLGVVLRKADNRRQAGYLRVRQLVAGDEDGVPLMYAFTTCGQFWRTMPDLVMEEDFSEDVNTDQEDHVYDDVRYAAMSRPFVKGGTAPSATRFGLDRTFAELVALSKRRREEREEA